MRFVFQNKNTDSIFECEKESICGIKNNLSHKV